MGKDSLKTERPAGYLPNLSNEIVSGSFSRAQEQQMELVRGMVQSAPLKALEWVKQNRCVGFVDNNDPKGGVPFRYDGATGKLDLAKTLDAWEDKLLKRETPDTVDPGSISRVMADVKKELGL